MNKTIQERIQNEVKWLINHGWTNRKSMINEVCHRLSIKRDHINVVLVERAVEDQLYFGGE